MFFLDVTVMVVPFPSTLAKRGISTVTLQMYLPESPFVMFSIIRTEHLLFCSFLEPVDWIKTVLCSINVWFFNHLMPTLSAVPSQQQVMFLVSPSWTETSGLWVTTSASEETPGQRHSWESVVWSWKCPDFALWYGNEPHRYIYMTSLI